MRKPNGFTYVGTLPCGCGVAACLDDDHPKDVAESVGGMISRGLVVDRLEHSLAMEKFNARCERYPHEEWQKRHEAAALKHRSKLPLDADAVARTAATGHEPSPRD